MNSPRATLGRVLAALASATFTLGPIVDTAAAGRVPILVGQVPPPGLMPMREGHVNHATWERLLSTYVDDRGLVRYAAWKREAERDLDDYLYTMRSVPVDSLVRSEALAYWINVYNALTVRAILIFYPLKSIKEKVSPLGFNVWDDVRMYVGTEERSLNDIEHEILRKMGEPRIHFAIVCASLGCPRLRMEAYRAERLEEQLDEDARVFLARADALAIDRRARRVRLSRILDWFGGDFGTDERSRLAFVARFAPSAADSAFLLEPGLRVSHSEYDWSLNERK